MGTDGPPGDWRLPLWVKDRTPLLSGKLVFVQKTGVSREVEPGAGEVERGQLVLFT